MRIQNLKISMQNLDPKKSYEHFFTDTIQNAVFLAHFWLWGPKKGQILIFNKYV